MTNKKQPKPKPKYNMDAAYQAAATALSFIISTRESFVIRQFNIRGDISFDYCFPTGLENSEDREGIAFVCDIVGTIAGHALYCGEILSAESLGIDDVELREDLDHQAKIFLGFCQGEYSGFIEEMAEKMSQCGRLCGHQIENIFLKHFNGKVEERDVEYK